MIAMLLIPWRRKLAWARTIEWTTRWAPRWYARWALQVAYHLRRLHEEAAEREEREYGDLGVIPPSFDYWGAGLIVVGLVGIVVGVIVLAEWPLFGFLLIGLGCGLIGCVRKILP